MHERCPMYELLSVIASIFCGATSVVSTSTFMAGLETLPIKHHAMQMVTVAWIIYAIDAVFNSAAALVGRATTQQSQQFYLLDYASSIIRLGTLTVNAVYLMVAYMSGKDLLILGDTLALAGLGLIWGFAIFDVAFLQGSNRAWIAQRSATPPPPAPAAPAAPNNGKWILAILLLFILGLFLLALSGFKIADLAFDWGEMDGGPVCTKYVGKNEVGNEIYRAVYDEAQCTH